MSKQIPLTRGQFAIVDDEDFGNLSKRKWHCTKQISSTKPLYAARRVFSGNNKHGVIVVMHHFVLQRKEGYFVDHINGNGLDNRKENLRYCTLAENNWNSKKTKGKHVTSSYKGVCWCPQKRKWRASAYINRKQNHLGYFSDEVEAARAYNSVIEKYHGEFAWLNQI